MMLWLILISELTFAFYYTYLFFFDVTVDKIVLEYVFK